MNGGVFCCHPGSPTLARWHEWTKIARKIFISDETALHAVMPKAMQANEMDVLLGGAYNCSLKYQPGTLADADVRIWHVHGDCNARPQKSLRAVEMWWPEYRECLRDNVGGIADWRGHVQHKYLDSMEAKLNAAGDAWREVAAELASKKKEE